MVTLRQLSRADLNDRLNGPGLGLRTGPFNFLLRSSHHLAAEGLAQMYAQMPLVDDEQFIDFSLDISRGRGLHRWFRRQACFLFDGQRVFEPLPAEHAYPLLEWAMNWCISSHAHQYLILHAAALERNGGVLVMPAPPGSGKSTLCAALVHSGWRLLSDELALVSLRDGRIWPLCRPVGLKNASIDVIRRFAPAAELSRVTLGTAKGSVAHMKAPTEHVAQMDLPAPPRWVVFPRYEAGAATALTPRPRATTVVELARNAFNVGVLAEAGFGALGDLVQASQCFDFRYSNLPEAMSSFETLAGDQHAEPVPLTDPLNSLSRAATAEA